MADCNGRSGEEKRNMLLVLFLCTVLLLAPAHAGSWANAVTVDDQRAPDCDPAEVFCHKLRTYNTWVAPQDSIASVPDLVGGPYAGSNVSVGGYVIKTPADLFAGMSFVANGSTTGELSINFNLDNDPALSLICPNGQTGMKMVTEPLSCLRRVGINILNPQCALDVDDTICINGVPIAGQDLPIAWYYQIINQTSSCTDTNLPPNTHLQQYFTPSIIDIVTTEAADTVFIGYQGGAIAFATSNSTSSFGDCRGLNAVDFQTARTFSSQVASGSRSFIGAGFANTASGTASVTLGGQNNIAEADRSVAGGANNNVQSTDSICVGVSNQLSSGGVQNAVFGGGNTLNRSYSLLAGQGLTDPTDQTYPFVSFGKYNEPNVAGITTGIRMFTIGDGTSPAARSNLFSITDVGDVYTKFGGTYVTGGADFQEFFEHAEGPVKLPIGTTVKILEDGMFRKAQQGEIPDGVISRRGGVLGNSDSHHWVGKYVMDDDTGKIKMEDGKRVISDKYDPSRPYIPREARDEWHTIGLVGQCEVLDSSPVDPRWVPMPRKAGARPGTTWYLIK